MAWHINIFRSALLSVTFLGGAALAHADDVATKAAHDCDIAAASAKDLTKPSDAPSIDFDKIDSSVAIVACENAVKLNSDNARLVFELGRALDKKGSAAEANTNYEKAAKLGSSAAIYNLGYNYENGVGVSVDMEKAMGLYKQAAALGDAEAMTNVGWGYENGKGLEQNNEKAAEWYRNAADAGNAQAMNNLGLAYENGRGVEKNSEKAAEWYRKSSDLGNADAMTNLGKDYVAGSGVEKNAIKAGVSSTGQRNVI